MNLRKRFGLSLGVLTLLGLSAAAAGAQTIFKGTFDLPEQAYWGSKLLPAGGYTLSVTQETTGINLVSLRGEGVSATFIAPSGYTPDTSNANCLKIESINGANVVRELDSSVPGRSYKFGVSKAVRNLALNGKAAPPITVNVSSAGF